jgi:hypothetical protein
MDKRKINEWKWKVNCLTLQTKAPLSSERPGRTADLRLLVCIQILNIWSSVPIVLSIFISRCTSACKPALKIYTQRTVWPLRETTALPLPYLLGTAGQACFHSSHVLKFEEGFKQDTSRCQNVQLVSQEGTDRCWKDVALKTKCICCTPGRSTYHAVNTSQIHLVMARLPWAT